MGRLIFSRNLTPTKPGERNQNATSSIKCSRGTENQSALFWASMWPYLWRQCGCTRNHLLSPLVLYWQVAEPCLFLSTARLGTGGTAFSTSQRAKRDGRSEEH